jgi:tRNA (adenine37-N6)-methyltransferase
MATFSPIGVVHTPFGSLAEAPRATRWADGAEGTIELFEPFEPGLSDLIGFERIWLLWHADQCCEAPMVVQPPFDTGPKGVFATRAPCRPNPIGLSCVRLLGVEGGVLRVADVDMADGTPLLDIKPYSTGTDCFPDSRGGWFDATDD